MNKIILTHCILNICNENKYVYNGKMFAQDTFFIFLLMLFCFTSDIICLSVYEIPTKVSFKQVCAIW